MHGYVNANTKTDTFSTLMDTTMGGIRPPPLTIFLQAMTNFQ